MSSNPWNDFQHDHVGEGLNQEEMSEMYHDEQNVVESSNEIFSTEEANDTYEDSSVNNSELDQTNVNDSDINLNSNDDIETINQNDENSSSGNPWNDFQHEHANEDLTRQEMSEKYHAEQDTEEISDEDSTAEETTNSCESPSNDENASVPTAVIDSNTNPESNDSSSNNPWNDFQHEHANEGLTRQEMSENYHAAKNSDEVFTTEETTNSCESPSNDDNASVPNAVIESNTNPESNNSWNDFQHKHANEGLTHQEMSEKYHAAKNSDEASTTGETTNSSGNHSTSNDNSASVPIVVADPNPNPVANQSTSGNPWNDFQHKHANEGLTPQEMSEKYHAEKDSNATAPMEDLSNNNAKLAQTTMVNSSANAEANHSTSGNSWNNFQHKHAGEGKTTSALADEYRKENAAHESSVSTEVQQKSPSNSIPNSEELMQKQETTFIPRQNQRNQKSRPSIRWNLYQHLHRGKYSTKQDMSKAYNQFKQKEKTFKWDPDFQLNVTPNGELQDPDSPAGQEAMKTGLFDEQNQCRRCGDLPYGIFQSKMFDMNITDRSKISSMYFNQTGTPHFYTRNLRQ